MAQKDQSFQLFIPQKIKSGPPCALHVFLLCCLVISHCHSYFLSFKSPLPPRLILNLTSFISEALVLFPANHFHPSLSLNSHSTSHHIKESAGRPTHEGRVGNRNPHITKQSSLACCQWLEKEVPPNTSWARGLLEDSCCFFKFLHPQPFFTAHTANIVQLLSHSDPSSKQMRMTCNYLLTQQENAGKHRRYGSEQHEHAAHSSSNTYITHSCSSSAWKWYVRLSIEKEKRQEHTLCMLRV